MAFMQKKTTKQEAAKKPPPQPKSPPQPKTSAGTSTPTSAAATPRVAASPASMRDNINKSAFRNSRIKKENSPILSSTGSKSHDFFDMKEVLLDPPVLAALSIYMRNVAIPNLMGADRLPDVIGGPEFGAVPMVMALCCDYFHEGNEVFPVILRKQKKDHGTEQEVEFCHRSTTHPRPAISG